MKSSKKCISLIVGIILIITNITVQPHLIEAIANAKILHDGFETAGSISDTCFWTPVSDVTFPAGVLAINGTKSLGFTETTPPNQWSTIFGANTSMTTLMPDTTYTISFKYKINTSGNNLQFVITESNTWQPYAYTRFNADTAASAIVTGMTYYKYNAANYNYVQFTFTTASAAGKFSYFTLQRADDTTPIDIKIDDFSIYNGEAQSYDLPGSAPVLLNNENFENGTGTYSRTMSSIDTDRPYVMNRGFMESNVIDGSSSIFGGITTAADNWDEMIRISSDSVPFDAGTTYTVNFRYKILENSLNFFYLIITNSDNAKSVYFGFDNNGANTSFMSNVAAYKILDEGNGVKSVSVSLLTKDVGTLYTNMAFGYKGGGRIIFDDISIYKGMNSVSINTAQISLGNPALESGANFEDGTTSPYLWTQTGAGYTASVSTAAASLINGTRSFAIRSTVLWSEELIYDYPVKPLDSNTRYTVSFKYKAFSDISYPNTAATRFYFLVNSDTLGESANRFQSFTADGKAVYLLNGAPWYNGIEDFYIVPATGGYYDAYVTFITQNAGDVRFKFGVANGGAYAIDDIKISKGLGISSQAILNTSKSITSFAFTGLNPVVTALIEGTNISAVVPLNTDLTGLVPVFSNSPTSSITVDGTIQISGFTANNFINPVVYKVTAEDGSYTNYTVSVVCEQVCSIVNYNISGNGENIITGVFLDTSLNEFLQNVVFAPGVTFSARDFNKQLLTGISIVGTGTVLSVYNPDMTLYKTYTVIIHGDVNGNGLINITDLAAVKSHILQITSLTGSLNKAGDIQNNNSVSISDLLAIKKHVLNIQYLNKLNSRYKSVYPEKITGNLHNPGMGWVALEEPTYAGHSNLGADGNIPMVDNIGLSTSWAHIEIAEGVYDWSNVDRTINYWTSLGKFINIRIATDTLVLPYTSIGVPPWLVAKYSIPTKTYIFDGFSPVPTYEAIDVTNPDYLRHLDIFLNALKTHLSGNNLVDTVEILGYGVWGEWHSGYDFDSYADRHDSLKNIIDRYVNVFKTIDVSMVLCAAWEYRDNTYPDVSINQEPNPTYQQYINWSSFDYAMSLPGVSFRRNAGAGALKYDYDSRLFSDYFRSNKREPLMAEYFSGIDEQIAPDPEFNVMEGIDDILFNLRPNNSTVLGWANTNVQKLYDLGHGYLYERGNEKLGYRISIDKTRFPANVSKNSDFTVLTSFSNTSVGRYLYDYPIKFELIDTNGAVQYSVLNQNANLKSLVNGEVLDVYTILHVPEELIDGNYRIAVSIVDGNQNPKIALGNGGDTNGEKKYILGEINISDANCDSKPLEKEFTYDQLNAYALKPNTSYSLTFEYTPRFNVSNFQFGNYDGYEVSAISEQGGTGATAGYVKWQDVSGETSRKTIKFTTKNYSDYKLRIENNNFGGISVGNCIIEEISGSHENFEGGSGIYNTNAYSQIVNNANVINGIKSAYIFSSAKGHKYGLSTSELKPDTTYTISFKAKTINETGNGGYFFLSVEKPGDVNSTEPYSYPDGWKNDFAEWYERADTPAKTFTYTFKTPAASGYRMYFGVHNKGSVVVDDIDIFEEITGESVSGSNIPEALNVVPVLNKGLGDTEGFESASFFGSASMYDWGLWQIGRLTSKSGEVISGNYSLLGKVEDAIYTVGLHEWLNFSNGKARYLAMQQGKTYRVSFKYKVLKKFSGVGSTGENTFFYLLARPESLGGEYRCDDGFTKFGQYANIGTTYQMSVDITLARQDFIDSNGNTVIDNFNDYIIQFGMYLPSEIVIDDIKVQALN